MIGKLPNESMYKNFAYHVSLLKEFTGSGKENDPRVDRNAKGMRRRGSFGRGNLSNSSMRGSFRGGLLSMSEKKGARRRRTGGPHMDGSIHSEGSIRKNSSAARAASFSNL